MKSYWDGEETVATFRPKPYHMAASGYVYGGLLGSIVDCHGTAAVAAAAYRAERRAMDMQPAIRFLTASLHVDYVRPNALCVLLEIRGKVKEIEGRKVVVTATVSAEGNVCVRREVVAVQVPESRMARQFNQFAVDLLVNLSGGFQTYCQRSRSRLPLTWAATNDDDLNRFGPFGFGALPQPRRHQSRRPPPSCRQFPGTFGASLQIPWSISFAGLLARGP